MYCKIKLIHENIKNYNEINYLSENKFLIKRTWLAENLRLIIKHLTE